MQHIRNYALSKRLDIAYGTAHAPLSFHTSKENSSQFQIHQKTSLGLPLRQFIH